MATVASPSSASLTARTLIADALSDIGVLDPNETMTDEMAQNGLRTLNRLLDRWTAEKLFVWAVTEVTATTSGASMTIGPGLTFDCLHPQALQPGCYYVKSGMSYPLPIWSREDYNAVILKAQSGEYPQGVFYDRLIPGTVKVWPVPAAPVEYHLQIMVNLGNFADLDTVYSFPDGYYDALFYSLTVRLPAAYNLAVDPQQAKEAANAKRTIRRGNVQVPVLTAAPVAIGRLNILTNQRQ